MRFPDSKLRKQLIAEGTMRVEGEMKCRISPPCGLSSTPPVSFRPRTAW